MLGKSSGNIGPQRRPLGDYESLPNPSTFIPPRFLLRRYLPIACLALIHALVDAVANFIEPLWPMIQVSRSLSESSFFYLLAITSIAPNFSQIVFGVIRDRFSAQFLLWLTPAIAAICLASFGMTSSVGGLAVALAIGYLAVGGFHPEAVVRAGSLLPENRTRALAIFLFGGNMGLAFGPAISGNLVSRFGAGALAWLVPPVLVLIGVIYVVMRPLLKASASAALPHSADHSSRTVVRHWKLALFFLGVSVFRVLPSVGMNRAIAFVLQLRGFESDGIGNLQSLFLFSGSVGILAVGAWFPRGSERKLIIHSTWLGILPLIGLAYPHTPNWLLGTLLVPAGIILNGTVSATVSYAHQLFPKDAGMATALAMGASYGTSGLIVAGMVTVFNDQFHMPHLVIAGFIPFLAVSTIGAFFLPRIVLPSKPESGT